MSILQDQKGSSLVLVMLLIAVVAVLGVAGYRVMNSEQLASTSSSSFSSSEPKYLHSSADVKRAENSLDTIDMENPDQLNQDVNDL